METEGRIKVQEENVKDKEIIKCAQKSKIIYIYNNDSLEGYNKGSLLYTYIKGGQK